VEPLLQKVKLYLINLIAHFFFPAAALAAFALAIPLHLFILAFISFFCFLVFGLA
jgi:hypothetical protein